MPASYPTSVKTFTTRNNGDTIQAAHVNDLQDEVNAIETGLKSGLAHNLIFTPDATFDIGATGATRPRNIFASGTLSALANSGHVLGGNADGNVGLRVSGTYTATGTAVGADLIPTITGAAGADVYGTRVAPVIVEAGSGTHAFLIGLVVQPPTITNGAATTTLTAALYIGGAATAGASNYALYIATGQSQINGQLQATSNFARSAVMTAPTITANQNNYSPTGIETTYGIRLASDASRDITGIAAQTAGTSLLLLNIGSQNIVLKHESGSSTAANRFACPGSVDKTLTPLTWAEIWYSSIDSRWFVAV